MHTFKETLKEFQAFLESKDHLIKKLNISDEEKEILINFFKKYPNLESKIDWNNKSLTFEDFRVLLDNEGKSKSQAKKYGIEGLIEGTDYKIVYQKIDYDGYIVYYPLNSLAAKTLANPKVAPFGVTGKWCISGGRALFGEDNYYWQDYLKKGFDFFFIFTNTQKYAISRHCIGYYADSGNPIYSYQIFNSKDKNIQQLSIFNSRLKTLFNEYPTYVLTSGYHVGPFGCIHSLDKKQLYYVPNECNLLEFEIPEGTEEIALIPDKFRQDPVSLDGTITHKVPKGAFYGNSNVRKIIFPKSLKKINYRAFTGCANLKEVSIPDTVISFDTKHAFRGCSSLQKVRLPNSIKRIGGWMFAWCDHLKKIEIPESVEVIEDGAFIFCTSLKEITMGPNIKEIQTSMRDPFDSMSEISKTLIFKGTEKQWNQSTMKKYLDSVKDKSSGQGWTIQCLDKTFKF